MAGVRASARVTAPQRGPVDAPRPRHLRVVEPQPRARRRLNTFTAIVVVVLVLGGMLAVAVSQTMLVQGQLRIDDLDERVATEQARYQQLRLKVAELESPDRVVHVAMTRLGMVPPGEVVYVTPERPAPTPTASGTDNASADESWQDVKPYLETRP